MRKALVLAAPAALIAAVVVIAMASPFETAKPAAAATTAVSAAIPAPPAATTAPSAAMPAPAQASAPADCSAKCASASEPTDCSAKCASPCSAMRDEARAGDQPAASSKPADTEAMLRRVMESDATRAIRGLATYDLARHLNTLSQLLIRVQCEGPEWRDRIEAAVGKPNVEALLARDPEKLSEESETLLGSVCTYFADVKTPKGTLGELAINTLFAVRHLAVGRKAPEIIGVDIDGHPMKLSDFRGKVVMISFYGYWCGACVELFPTERAVVENFAGRPFALVGVNSDAKDQYKKGLAKIPLSWHSFWDAGTAHGPIAETWQVEMWPTSYIIDQEGIVRFKDLRKLDTLKRAIEGLVATAERAAEGPATK